MDTCLFNHLWEPKRL